MKHLTEWKIHRMDNFSPNERSTEMKHTHQMKDPPNETASPNGVDDSDLDARVQGGTIRVEGIGRGLAAPSMILKDKPKGYTSGGRKYFSLE